MRRHSVELLEARQLLSFDAGGWTNLQPGGSAIYVEDTGSQTDSKSAVASRLAVSAALNASALDATAVRADLVNFVDLWNGGQQGRNGTSGMGVYATNWDGLFRANLDQQFQPVVNTYTNDMTVIAQSRAVYINVEAYRSAPVTDRARFLNAVQRGADYLLGKSVDPNTYNGKPGGLWWGLQPDGVSPPTHTTPIGGTQPRYKDAYGQVQSLFALAQAYSITGDVDHLNGAFKQLDVWYGQFADAANGPGAFLPTANENYTQRIGNRNLDYMTHAFEALLTLNQVTPASDPRKAGLSAQITNIGNFITARMYRDAAGSTTMGYLPWWYDAQWSPSTTTGQQYSTPGHNFEVAFLLSRAVEQGFNSAWLNVADKLVAYTLRYGFDDVPTSPTYGSVLPEEMKFDGSRLDPTPNNLVWWQESEAARALLHFATVRGRTDLLDEYEAASAFIQNHFIDPSYGGWYQYLNPTTLQPTTTDKGTVWTGGYHEAMLDAERIRLAALSDVTLPAAADAYVRDGTYATQNFGTTTDLNVKKHSAAGYSRESYLRFNLSDLSDIETATLRLFGKSTSSTQSVGVGLYAVSNTTWGETSLNWNNRPVSAGTPIGTKTVTGTASGAWYTFDVTPYLQQQKAAGATTVTFALKGLAQTDQVAVFNSDENSANKPQLVVQQAVSQALVVSTGNVTVPEGSTANFTVKLAAQPTGDVTVNVARTSGDADVSVQAGSSLVFTPTNWNTAQTVMLAAAEDADSANGSAAFTVSATGLTSKAVTASEADNDVTNQPVTVRASADAYVRDGSYATTNFGGATELTMKNHSAPGYTRESYLRFSLSEVPSVGSAVLRLYGGLQQAVTGGLATQVYGVSDVSWSETAINWNNRPAASTGVLATTNVVNTPKQWYEIDLTSYVQQQKAAGATAVTFLLRNAVVNDAVTSFASDESTASQPQLVLTPGGAAVPQIVTSLSDVTVGEGATAPFTVRLSSPPTVNITVNVARTSGDTDLTVQSGSSLVFTPSDWNTPQTVTLAAAQDADSTNGSAAFTVSSTGLASKTVAATESEDDPVVGPITVRAAADATVRDGTNAATNFGTTTDLTIKKNASVGFTREAYLRFSLTGASSVGSATLRLYGNLQEANAGGLNLQVYGVDNVSWSETGINWNNRPAANTGVLATKNVPDTTKRWYEIDLTSYLQQRKAAGATAVTLLLRNATNSNAVTSFASDEAAANQPQLVITPAIAGPVGVVVDTASLAVPEGFSSSFDVRLASAPASNVIVSVVKQPGGDTDLNANKTSLTFTPANWNVNQSVTVNATDDNTDTISGSALFVVTPAGGAAPFTVVATEIENDGKGGANVLAPVDDAYVRDGAYADTNFGGTNDIVVKRSSGPGYTREGYLTFDLSNDDTIAGGRLRLYGRLTATTNASLVTQVFPATAGANWSQSTLTWNNRPAAGTWPVGSITVTGTTARWYEIDVTSYLQAEKAAGRNRVTFVLSNTIDSDAMTSFASFETQGNWPELVIVRNYPSDTDTRLMRAIDVADQQLRSTLSQLGTDATKYVYVTQPDGNWTVVNASTWTSGMLPASLWYMAKETGDPFWTTEAIRRTLPLEGQKTQKDDLAFRLAYAYWPLYAATNNPAYRQVLIDAAASKVAQYNGTVHAFLSPGRASTSGNPNADFGVLTDQITDVELVLWAAQQTNNTDWYDKAIDHLHTMTQYSVRADGSTYQWIYFNSKTGAFVGGEGYQGYSATSTWSRGQAWAIYGFTAAYRLTGQPEFLAAAKKVTDWYLNHLPAGDMVPYWDFNDPTIPNTYKDSSAAAVAADGMAQLATLDSNPADAAKYRKAAGDTLAQLASPAYLNENVTGSGGRGILLHGAWFVPDPINNGDASVIWGDYFFLEAINKYMGSKTAP
jgi:mannose/cellobiose epimerase-like protein (N-acyl-D-glucosamine 2-epimerase family)